jgi:hypothetical protein
MLHETPYSLNTRDGAGTNAAALAFLAQWYATPDETPPAYWDELETLIAAHPIDFGRGPRHRNDTSKIS